jgi:hypothetical protein
MKSIGFKEWAIVCQALCNGKQSVIVRKGGIAEGREGFSFRHPEFFLFPTWFHEQPGKIRNPETELPAPNGDLITIDCFARVEMVRAITSWSVAEALEPFHILKPEVIRERFDYGEAPGLQVAFARIFRLAPRWTFPNEKRFSGCRSWVELHQPPNDLKLEAVLTDAEHEQRMNQLLAIVDGDGGRSSRDAWSKQGLAGAHPSIPPS